MHAEAYAFVARAAGELPIDGKRVLEIGSKNINGSVRDLFASAKSYHGIDAVEGPDVDEAIDAKDYDGAHKFDIVVSCETLEHEAKPQTIIACAERALKPGGVLILTAAGDDRAPHSAVDGGPLQDGEHYGNISQEQLEKLLHTWTDVQIHTNDIAHDIYAVATYPKPVAEKAKAKVEKTDDKPDTTSDKE